jgi:hypothetical protein
MNACLGLLMCVAAATPVQKAPAVAPIIKAQSSMACGIAPIPPIGCRVGACQCDQNGNNCSWTFVCN